MDWVGPSLTNVHPLYVQCLVINFGSGSNVGLACIISNIGAKVWLCNYWLEYGYKIMILSHDGIVNYNQLEIWFSMFCANILINGYKEIPQNECMYC